MSTPADLRDQGIATRTNAADPRLILAVDQHIADLAASGRRFSANDLRDLVPAATLNLIGPRLRAAAMRRPREIVKVGSVASSLNSTHAKEIAVWRGYSAQPLDLDDPDTFADWCENRPAVMAFVAERKKIHAIREIRTLTGASLIQAKEAADLLWARRDRLEAAS